MNYLIHTDGGSRGNPGPGAIGIVIANKDGEIIYEASKYLGRCTNNEAEYIAVLQALKISAAKKFKNLTLYIDSELVTKQLLGEYKVKNERLKKIYQKIKGLENNFVKIDYIHVKRDKNKRADSLVNEALDKNGF